MDDREKEIEEMAEIIETEFVEWLNVTGVIPKGTTYYAELMCCIKEVAKKLSDKGYGNVEKAIKEFADELSGDERLSVPTQIFIGGVTDELIKGRYGNDK